jgi:hypothetical protein
LIVVLVFIKNDVKHLGLQGRKLCGTVSGIMHTPQKRMMTKSMEQQETMTNMAGRDPHFRESSSG